MTPGEPPISKTEPLPPERSRFTRSHALQFVGKRRFYLPEVDGIRCLAVLLVWIHHYPEGPGVFLHQLRASGWVGVNVFLVLSSFLITSLLMLEAQTKGSISLPRFYSRRFLRIWPLLGLTLLLNYLLLPAINYFPGGFGNPNLLHDVKYHAIPNALLLGNWSVAVFHYLTYGFCNHLWTINLEEQFYLLWPILMFYLIRNPRRLLQCCVALIAVSFVARFYYVSVGFKHPALWVSTITRLDPLALGGILAVFYPNLKNWLVTRRLAFDSLVAVGLFCASLVTVIFIVHNWTWTGTVWWKLGAVDALVAVCVCCIILNPILAFVLRLPVIAWLGKISYGLYVYQKFLAHGRPSAAVRSFCVYITGGQPNLMSWLLGLLINSLALVAVSAASYYLFERVFLKFKERFETILSRPA
jgi:peptidoglycan/LPS O-acetylase OafA/YrhL